MARISARPTIPATWKKTNKKTNSISNEMGDARYIMIYYISLGFSSVNYGFGVDGMDGEETGADQTSSQTTFESIPANLGEDNYNGTVECDVNEVIPDRIESADQVIPS